MRATRLTMFVAGVMLVPVAGILIQLNAVSAAGDRRLPVASPSIRPVAIATSPTCVPGSRAPMELGIAFTSRVGDTSALDLHLPWGSAGDGEGQMVEDYGAYNGDTIEEHLPVYDVTSGTMHPLFGHNAIDIGLDSGTPLYAVTSGVVYTVRNWTIPGFPQGYAVVVVSDTLRDDSGNRIAFLYGHVREFETQNGQRVDAGTWIARSGGAANDPGRGFTDMPNVHFEVIESSHPLTANAGTVNPRQFLENLFAYAMPVPPVCMPGA